MRALFYVGRRLLAYASLLLVLLLLTFLVYAATPTEPANFIYGQTAHPTAEQFQHGNELLGVDRPVLVQYADYVWHLVRGDFGNAWNGAGHDFHGRLVPGPAVWPQLRAGLAVSASTAAGGIVLLALFALPLGLIAARRPRGVVDQIGGTVTLIGVTVHPLVLALLLQLFLARRFHVLPQSGYCPLHAVHSSAPSSPLDPNPFVECNGVVDWARHLILPWLTFAAFFTAIYTRMVRAQVIDVLRQPYIHAAEARGVGPWRILLRHAFPNAAGSVLAMLAMDAGTAIGITIFIDAVYGLHGIGFLSVRALSGQFGFDRPIILGVVTVIALAVFALNLLVDYLQALIDPRVVDSGPQRVLRA